MFNPAKASDNIRNEFIDYISTNFSFSDKNLQKQLVLELNKSISKGPYLEINDVFEQGLSINQLIEEGVISKSFRELEVNKPHTPLYKRCIPLERPLYLHQEKAIRKIVSGKNAVISTGTGSGKTNCFLIPVINELLKEKENGTLGPCVRAMLIYPMNALANDQMKNIRKILMYYPDITFGMYNGETEYNESNAISVYKSMFANERIPELKDRLPNEILSRDEMKKTPPNILFTNYSMLEHLLFRPQDDVIFSNADFKFIVLDEAHVYTGATGIETSLLLRRLKARISRNGYTQFILTSATLGSDSSCDDDIVQFANNLCGEEFSKDCIIRSTRETYLPNGDFIKYPSSLYKDIADESRIVKDVLTEYKIQFDDKKTESELLYDFVLSSDLYKKMRISFSGITDIENLKNKLDVDIETAISFISICSRANKNGKNLLDARFHFFVRALEGCFLSLSPSKQLFLTRRNHFDFNDVDYAVFEVAVCEDCGKYAFVGRIKDNKLLQVNNNTKEEEISYFFLSEEENDDIEDDEIEEDLANNRIQNQEKYSLCAHCSTLYHVDDIPDKCSCGYSDFLLITRAKSTSRGAKCGNCHVGLYKRFYLGGDAATAVLATSLYEELPEIEYKSEEIIPQKKNIFLKSKTNARKVSQKSGRQFLCFSDSRQEAAKFACYLGKSYDEFLRRRGICQIIDENKSKLQQGVHTISDYVGLLTNYFTANKSFAKSNFDDTNLTEPSRRNAWVAMLNELARFNSKTSLTSLGILQFSYLGNTEEVIDIISKEYNAPKDVVQNLLDLLAFEIVKKGAIRTDNDSEINDDNREYIFYSPRQRFIKKNRGPELSSSISSWMPKTKIGKQGEHYRTNILYYVMKSLDVDASTAYKILEDYFDFLVEPDGNEYHMEDINHDGTYVMPAKYFQVKIPGTYNTKWYKCKKCGKVSQFSIRNHCSTVRCDGLLDEIQPEKLSKNNHYANLYFSKRMSPLFIKEHTAQLNKKESAEYQEQFVRKEINALSCSTTFEMGVDVGDLETVFLRDVPPLPSNYAQRAGRAGRSVDATAYALTFAKLSSHDLSFFKNPEKMIQGTILPPLFKIDNEKIVRRHIYAIALSMFFQKNTDCYNKNDAELFLNKKKYKDFIGWLESKPLELEEIIKKSIPNINDLYTRLGIDDYTWLDDFIGVDGILTQLVNEYESNIKNFEKLIKENRNSNIGLASIYEKKLKAYTNNKLIDFLARGNVLPKYGFPADTVELKQNMTAKNIKKLSLTRDLQVAIAEYAPSSEIVADGRLYTSRYIAKDRISNDNKEWHTAYIATCTNECCKTKNYSLTPIGKRGVHCISCDTILDERDFHESIEPRNGFITEKEDKDVPMKHQEKNYKSEDYYIGNKSAKTIEKYYYRVDKTYIKVESTTNDSMMVESSTSFYVCPYCGYAISGDEANSDTKLKKELKNRPLIIKKGHFGLYKECACRELQRKTLHHVFNTDVAKISFSCDSSNYETMISALYALLYSISEKLNIERRDLKACLSLMLKKKNNRRYSIIIYDSVPGGAGHSRRLVTKDGKVLSSIFHAALDRVNECNCNPSCYNCLRSYDNQRIHDVLDRTRASEFLQQFEGEFVPMDEEKAKEFF